METRSALRTIGCFILTALATRALGGSTREFQVIAKRNAFGLRSPPVLEQRITPPELPKPARELKISGIVAFHNIRKAALYAIEKGKAPKPYMLDEGEQEDGIKVVAIDSKSQTVRVERDGAVTVLDFATDALPPSMAPPLPQPPVVPPRSLPIPPRPPVHFTKPVVAP